ncbi:MAG: dihydroorotase [Candidatus Dormibacteraceae bacterium]
MSAAPAGLVIAGGTVYSPSGPVDADVRVAQGRIAAIEPRGTDPGGAEVVDAAGLLVLPGAIDVHVHGRDPGFPEKETFESLTAAAVVGGVTTVFDMPNTVPGVDGREAFEAKLEAVAARARTDFGLWGLVRSGSTAGQIADLASAGAIGLKAYLGYAWDPGARRMLYGTGGQDLEPPCDYGTLVRLAPALVQSRLRLGVHAEDAGVLIASQRPIDTYADLLASRPAAAEAVAVAALGAVARTAGLAVHVCHLASAAGLAAARAARRSGATMTLEACPHHLWLSDQDQERLGPRLKGYPLVRTADDQAALRAGLADGEIQIVATDHAPHTEGEKSAPLAEAAPGNPGVQTLLVSCLELARAGGDLGAAVRWVSWWPAFLFGLAGRKGGIEPGADADLVLVDPAGETLVGPATALSRQRHGLLDGRRFGFAVRATYLRGRLVARDGAPAGDPAGQLVRPGGEPR